MTPAKCSTPVEHISLDLWAANLEFVTADLTHWLARVEHRIAASADCGVSALIMPEYTCAQWLAFAPADLPPLTRLDWLAKTGAVALDALAKLVAHYRVSLLAGTIPYRKTGTTTIVNRAWFLTPDGQAVYQDKLSLTPAEETGEDGATACGDAVNIFHWMGLKVAMIVCLDVEYTALWARLGTLDLDLVLVPAKTNMITGYCRVFGCAKSRAIELQTVVCVVGAVGVPMGDPATDTGVGGAAAFLPCDNTVSPDGVFAALPPQHAIAQTDLVLTLRDLPVGQCRAIRRGAAEAEVNPASWSAKHLRIIGG